MFLGVCLSFIGTLFQELTNSITKHKGQHYHFIQLGVISSFFACLAFSIPIAYKLLSSETILYLNPESIPLLILRLILEILQSYFTILAITSTDRSTFSIIRILTIPLLIGVDFFLGYSMSLASFIGIFIILIFLFGCNYKKQSLNFNGWQYILFTTINAVITISLFKYSITHYGNSLEIDQAIMIFGSFIFFCMLQYKSSGNTGLSLIYKEKIWTVHGLFVGLSALLMSYSYIYLNASEATAIKRAGEVIWSVVSGFIAFKEKNIGNKILLTGGIVLGIFIMLL